MSWAVLLALLLAAPSPKKAATFSRDVRPILEKRCSPCHFEGGKMHERLPFDQPATIVKLGERLFTRIRNDKERAVIRKFLASTRR